jgi:hypothetical protein
VVVANYIPLMHQEVAMANGVARYQVTIRSKEPTYARARGIEELLYVGIFNVIATGPDEATMRATELFREAQLRGVLGAGDSDGDLALDLERRS